MVKTKKKHQFNNNSDLYLSLCRMINYLFYWSVNGRVKPRPFCVCMFRFNASIEMTQTVTTASMIEERLGNKNSYIDANTKNCRFQLKKVRKKFDQR